MSDASERMSDERVKLCERLVDYAAAQPELVRNMLREAEACITLQAAEIDRLRSLAAVSAAGDEDTAKLVEAAIAELSRIAPDATDSRVNMHKETAGSIIFVLRRLSASYSAACGERDEARAKALEDAAKVCDGYEPKPSDQLPVHVFALATKHLAQQIRTLKETK